MPEFTINPIQKEAITFAAGTMQVLAGPGSGKTFVITQRIRYLIEHVQIEPSEILVITFTKAAADEMQQRFEKLVENKKYPVSFGTFHALFYHILKQTVQYQKFTLISETEKRKLLLKILQMPSSSLFWGNEKIEYLIRTISYIKNNGENFEDCTYELFAKEKVQDIYRQYNEYLLEFHKMDFDDMGLLCLKLFQKNPQILAQWQQKYRYILIDEFQDINLLQYQIIRYLALPENNLFVVGDDDQSIYGFRGARADMMQNFMQDYANAQQLLLDVNYRCHEQIVENSLQVIAVNKTRFVKAIRAAHKDGAGICFHNYVNQEEEYEELLQMLTLLSQKEPIQNAAVIYRSNYECILCAEKLLLNKIPFIMKEALQSRYDHFVIKDILAYLEFAHGNRSQEMFYLFMNRPLRYLKKDSARGNPVTLEELLLFYKSDFEMQNTVRKLFYDLEKIKAMRPYLAIHYVRKVIGYDAYIKENYDIDTKEKLMQIADDFQEQAKMYQDFETMNDYISQCRKLTKDKQIQAKSEQEKTKKGISLLTMHASKGLEFDLVFLPDINEGKVPSRQSVTPEAIEEERRMFYVAMTRARKELHILFCGQKEGKDVPSRFLAPIIT